MRYHILKTIKETTYDKDVEIGFIHEFSNEFVYFIDFQI